MKTLRFLSCLAMLAMAFGRLHGQIPDAGDNTDAIPAGATIIDSDELRMDQAGHTAVFTGNVVVTGTNFKMTCEGMTVNFTSDSKIDNIVAKGTVVILQPGRITHCGQAQYFHDEDKFVLTDGGDLRAQPDILDNQNEIQAPTIIIHRGSQSLETVGRTKTKVIDKGGSGSMLNNSNPK